MSTGEMYYLIMAIAAGITFAVALAACEIEDRRRRSGAARAGEAPRGAHPAR